MKTKIQEQQAGGEHGHVDTEQWLISDLVDSGRDRKHAVDLVRAYGRDELRRAVQTQRAAEREIYDQVRELDSDLAQRVRYAVCRVIDAVDPDRTSGEDPQA